MSARNSRGYLPFTYSNTRNVRVYLDFGDAIIDRFVGVTFVTVEGTSAATHGRLPV